MKTYGKLNFTNFVEKLKNFCLEIWFRYSLELHSAYCIYLLFCLSIIPIPMPIRDDSRFPEPWALEQVLGTICPYPPHWNTRLNYSFPWITSRLSSSIRCREQSAGKYAGSNFEIKNGNELRKSLFNGIRPLRPDLENISSRSGWREKKSISYDITAGESLKSILGFYGQIVLDMSQCQWDEKAIIQCMKMTMLWNVWNPIIRSSQQITELWNS